MGKFDFKILAEKSYDKKKMPVECWPEFYELYKCSLSNTSSLCTKRQKKIQQNL